ncbi:hypothetical protein FRC10_003139 [Ceratobasidium sp. 414]|nr:hypothetical protein FRC10_003139 [Ceratobasidium sp. 414]
MAKLPEMAISSLYQRANMSSGQGILYYFNTDLNYTKLPKTTLIECLRLFQVKIFGKTVFLKEAISAESLPLFLQLLAKIPGHCQEILEVFADLQQLLPLYPGTSNYLAVFTQQREGFVVLADIASLQEYISPVIELVINILNVTANQILKYPKMTSYHPTYEAIPGPLDAARLVVQSKSSNTAELSHLMLFMCNIITLLAQIYDDALVTAFGGPVVADIYASLVIALEYQLELVDVVDQWENMWQLRPGSVTNGRFPYMLDMLFLLAEGTANSGVYPTDPDIGL